MTLTRASVRILRVVEVTMALLLAGTIALVAAVAGQTGLLDLAFLLAPGLPPLLGLVACELALRSRHQARELALTAAWFCGGIIVPSAGYLLIGAIGLGWIA